MWFNFCDLLIFVIPFIVVNVRKDFVFIITKGLRLGMSKKFVLWIKSATGMK